MVFIITNSNKLKKSFFSLITNLLNCRQGAPRKRRSPQPGIKGRERFKTEESFYENPYPECICSSKRQHEMTQSHDSANV